ncbi:MAG TPA: Xaa-Pro peptidase family protein, partial [Stenomitos sp.]
MSQTDARFGRRVASLQRMLPEHGLDALLITHLPNIRYLSGFTGSAARLLVSKTECFLIVDFRYYVQAALESPHCTQVQAHGAGFEEAMVEAVLLSEARQVGFESGYMSFWDHGRLEVSLPKGIRLIPSGGQTEELRRLKDEQEIEALRTAARVTSEAIADLVQDLRPGMTEAELAAQLEYRFRARALEQAAFDTLVASGDRSARIHARASGHVIARGEPILIDCGASFEGYKADMSRTVSLGDPDRRFSRVHGAVSEALERVLAAIRPGASLRQLDALARETLHAHGLAETF